VEAVYAGVLRQYREEYMLYNIASAALSHALPRLSAALQVGGITHSYCVWGVVWPEL